MDHLSLWLCYIGVVLVPMGLGLLVLRGLAQRTELSQVLFGGVVWFRAFLSVTVIGCLFILVGIYLHKHSAGAEIPGAQPAEAAVSAERKSVADQFGKNTISVDCANSRAEDGGPSPCALIRVVNPDVTRKNTRFTARLVSDTELKIVVCTMTNVSGKRSPLTCGNQLGDHTVERSYHYATDQNGRGVDLYRISEVRFVRAGWAVVVDWISVEK